MVWQVNNHCVTILGKNLFDLSFIFEISIFYFYSLGCVPRFLKIFDFFSCIFPRENAFAILHELERFVFLESNISGTKSWREKIDEKP